MLRLKAKYADPVLLPAATLLNGLGLVMIHRLDLAHPRPAAGADAYAFRQLIWSAIGVVGAIAVIWFVKDHRILRRYTYTAMVVGLGLLRAAAGARPGQDHQRLADLDRLGAAQLPAR